MSESRPESDHVAELLHAEHVNEFVWMRGTDLSAPMTVSECGNCQRWARYAVSAGLSTPPGGPS